MNNVVPAQPEPLNDAVEYEGHILHAEAYPRDDGTISLHLLYHDPATPSSDTNFRGQRFKLNKGDAATLAKGILEIIAAPNTQIAWDAIAENL